MDKRTTRLAVASAIACMFSATGAYAAQGSAAPSAGAERTAGQKGGAIDIVTWDQAELRKGFSAEHLMDMNAKGNKGEDIGDVKDILVDRNGKVSALIISHGGIFGIGDKELRVPFNQVKMDPKLENILVPIAKENVEQFRIRDDRQARAGGELKVSELLDDEVSLRGGAKYGEVKDIIISREGQVTAIVVDADDVQRRGRYAMPWRGDVYDPARSRFSYDYERSQLDNLRPFNYSALGITEPAVRGASPGQAASSARAGGTDITTWDQVELRQGYSAEHLMDMNAKGNKGEDIGDVKDILVDRNGKVSALIISHGGIFGIGDKELRVPFNQVKMDPKLENILVPIAKENVENFRIREDRQARAAGEVKLSEVIGDQVVLRGGAKYGDVQDVIISRDGQVKAVVVDADDAQRRGRYAMPWRGDRYDAAQNRLSYDYDRNQIDRLRPFDYSALNITGPRQQRSAASQPGTSAGGTAGRGNEGRTGSDASKR